jgi:exodeoxyribonuclease VII small subunit
MAGTAAVTAEGPRIVPSTLEAMTACDAPAGGRRACGATALSRECGAGAADYNRRFSADCMTTDPRPDPAPAVPASYEVALSELESLVASMEGGQLPLEGLLASYRRGTELLQYCRARLEAVEQQVKVLEDGQLRPWPAT